MYNLYKQLKAAGFPQGGQGTWIQDPESDEKVYVPSSSEIFALFLGDPKDWQKMTDAMARVWIDNKI